MRVSWTMTSTKERTAPADADWDRFLSSHRLYLETSAFNRLFDRFSVPELEIVRDQQRQKGLIFVTSPMLLWEIMLVSDRDRADAMLMGAQALFDPVLLATPTEIVVRYLEEAYGRDDILYDVRSHLEWATLWPAMTNDLRRTFVYHPTELIAKTRPIRKISRNLGTIIAGRPHPDETVDITRTYVNLVYGALADDLKAQGVDEVTAKFVILYTFLVLLAQADLDGAAARDFWMRRGFVDKLEHAEVSRAFVDFPEIFEHGPILSMALMAAHQYRRGIANRGAIHDGFHVVYAPYVHGILSNDAAFLSLSEEHPFFATRLLHMSNIDLVRGG